MTSPYRIHPQPSFNFGGLVIDNFAGGGGASTGIEMALGRPVDIAINHDPEAIAMHEINHPHTKHFCESVWEVNPREITGGRPVDLCWFSPDCKHFSKAKGGKPVRKEIRGLAWVAIRYAATVRPRVIMLENVEEFVTWGPLAEGRPCPKNKGRTFNSFVNALRRHGYQVEWKELRANLYGAATIRKRLFLIARCDGQPIVWPSPTHLASASAEVKAKQAKPQRLAADIIDWSLPCPSIFTRKRPLAENTLRRIARGIQRYVIDSAEPFIVSYYGTKNGKDLRNQALDQPLRTQTTENRFALVAPVITKFRTNDRGSSIETPLPTVTANSFIKRPGGAAPIGVVAAFLAKHYGGNETPGWPLDKPISTLTTVDHHAVVMAHIQRDFGGSIGHAAGEPLATTTAGGGGKSALVASSLIKLRGTCRDGQPVTEPAATISAQGNHLGEVRAFLLKYYEHGTGQSLADPLHTITTKDRIGLVMIKGEPYQIVDIGMRMLEPHELYAAQGFPADYIHDRTATGKRLSKASQVRMCGNSVCPPVAAALVRANLVDTQRGLALEGVA